MAAQQRTLLAISVSAILLATQAQAQDAMEHAGGTIEEVVVTAQKRNESVQDVPISITAFDAQFVKDRGLSTVADVVAFTPGLTARVDAPSQSVFAIRGIGTNAFSVSADPSVGIFIDDVYAGHPIIANSAFFDVERIEVVKGPQGTLFGRNTSAGAISIASREPEIGEKYLDTRLGFGDHSQQIYEAIGNFSASDTAGLRIGARYERRDGTFRNVTDGEELNGKDDLIARIAGLAHLTDRLTAHMLVDYSTIDSYWGATAVNPDDPESTADVDTVEQNPRDDQNGKTWRAAVRLEYEISDSLTLTSLTGYLDAKITATPGDFDLATLRVLQFAEPNEFRYLSQELRLNGSNGPFEWFVGASVRDEDNFANTELRYSDFDVFTAFGLDCALDAPGLCQDDVAEPSVAHADNFSWGVFGDVVWQATDHLSLTLGGRYTRDEKEIIVDTPYSGSATSDLLLGGNNVLESWTVAPTRGEKTWSDFSPRFAARYDLGQDAILYANVSRGYKAGGFNSAPNVPGSELAPGETQFAPAFDPETNTAYEIGIKSVLADRRVKLNLAAFYLDYSDYQVETQIGGPTFTIQNVADAENMGIDFEAQVYLTDNLDVMLGYSWLDSDLKSGVINVPDVGPVDVAGNRMPFAPESTFVAIANYVLPSSIGDWRLSAAYNYTDDQFISPLNDMLDNVQIAHSHFTLDLRAALASPDDRWSVALIGENVTDERWFGNPTFIFEPLGTPNIGRLIRGELTYRF
jgi:iron complex outermembrane receptor protein